MATKSTKTKSTTGGRRTSSRRARNDTDTEQSFVSANGQGVTPYDMMPLLPDDYEEQQKEAIRE